MARWWHRAVAFVTGGAVALAIDHAVHESHHGPHDGADSHTETNEYALENFYDDGTLRSVDHVTDGKLEGRHLSNWPNGKTAIIGWYHGGAKCGLWSYHNEDGEAIVLREYAGGKYRDIVNQPQGKVAGIGPGAK